MILYIPVLKRLWKQHELWDGTYTITDLFDITEALLIKSKNQQLMFDSEMSKINSELDKVKTSIPSAKI